MTSRHLTQLSIVGGGHGLLLAAILRANPQLSGILFDLPHVIAGAQKYLEAAGLGGRWAVVGGDFFQAVPSGGDVYLLSRVIHDWEDERSMAILKNCRRAMGEQGKLLLIERLMPTRVEPSVASQTVALSDLNMLVNTGGCERTEAQYRALFEGAGFTLTHITPTQSPMHVIEGVRK
jgi:hypothetical protein